MGRSQDPITALNDPSLHAERIEGDGVISLPEIPVALRAGLKVNGQRVMDRGDHGPLETSHQQNPVPEGLYIVEDIEGVPGKGFLEQLKCSEAKEEHLGKESKARHGKFKKIQRPKDFPGSGWGNKISVHAP
jgi:hypothetical protein